MVKLHIVHTAPLNAPGAAPVLTRAHAWAGLARKARHPEDFVPVVASCEILRDSQGGEEEEEQVECIVRFKPSAGVPHAAEIRETCTLGPPCRLDYAMEDGSTAANVIGVGGGGGSAGAGGEEPADLYLTFAFCWDHPGVARGSAEERELRERHEKIAAVAVRDTIAGMRRLALGELKG